MARSYKTVQDQNVFDIAIQMFGTLNNMDKVLRQVPDINGVAPTNYDMTFDETANNLAIGFGVNNTRISTGDLSPDQPIYRTFDDTFDDTFY